MFMACGFRRCRGVASSTGDLNCTDRRGRDAAISFRENGEWSDSGSAEASSGVVVMGMLSGKQLGPATASLSRRRFGRGTGRWYWSGFGVCRIALSCGLLIRRKLDGS